MEPLVTGREGQIHPASPDRGGSLHPTQLHTLVEVRRSLPSVQYFGQVRYIRYGTCYLETAK